MACHTPRVPPPEVSVRRATAADAETLARLATHPDVEPFLSVTTARDPVALREEIAQSEREPQLGGRFVFEVAGRTVGGAAVRTVNRRSRIAAIGAVVVDPRERGRGLGAAGVRALAEQLLTAGGFHRVELEAYGDNPAALRTFERAGFVREGVRRRAYWRRDAWQDGVLFGRLAEDGA
jgi:RimJ/RimL family protein N-acetyltransferase